MPHTDAASSPAIASTPLQLATFEGGGEQTAISAPGNGNIAVTTPADPSFAAGAGDVVEAVNSALFVYSRTGAAITSFSINGMINNPTSSGYVVQYPHVVYDPVSGVFILMVLQSKTSTCQSQIAVMDSQTNPALPWVSRGTITLDPQLSGDILANLSMALTGTLVMATSDYRACSRWRSRRIRGKSDRVRAACRSRRRDSDVAERRIHRRRTDRCAAGHGAGIVERRV